MEKTMAVVDQVTNLVINIIIGDENSPTESNTFLVPVNDNVFCSVGFLWNGVDFLNKEGLPVYLEDEIN